MRQGRAFRTEDGGIDHLIKVVPIEPRGWIIMVDEKVSYEGGVFTYQEAMGHIKDIEAHLVVRAAKQHTEFEELVGLKIEQIKPPNDVKTEMQLSIASDIDINPDPAITVPARLVPATVVPFKQLTTLPPLPPKPVKVKAAFKPKSVFAKEHE